MFEGIFQNPNKNEPEEKSPSLEKPETSKDKAEREWHKERLREFLRGKSPEEKKEAVNKIIENIASSGYDSEKLEEFEKKLLEGLFLSALEPSSDSKKGKEDGNEGTKRAA